MKIIQSYLSRFTKPRYHYTLVTQFKYDVGLSRAESKQIEQCYQEAVQKVLSDFAKEKGVEICIGSNLQRLPRY